MEKLIIRILVFILIVSCTNESRKTSIGKKSLETEHVKREQIFKNAKISYHWDFKRKYAKKLTKKLSKDLSIKSFYYRIYNDTLVMIDWNNKNLVLFDKDLNKIKNIGKSGEGPNENGTLMYFGKEKSNYYVYDFTKQIIKKIDDSGKVIAYFKIPHSYRGKHLQKDIFFLSYLTIDDSLHLAKYTFNNNSLLDLVTLNKNLFENLKDLDSKYINSLVFDGNFDMGTNKNISIYFLKKGGYFIVINDTSKYHVYRTIDKTPLPKGITRDLGGGISVPVTVPDNQFFLSATTDDKYIYLLNTITAKPNQAFRVIDIYAISDGSYKGSIKVKDLSDGQKANLISLDIHSNLLYVYYDDLTMVKYAMEEISE